MNKHAPALDMQRIQKFVELGGPAHGAERVAALRAELAKKKFTGFLVPRADEHQNEYVAPGSERLLWLTGFSGSAGLAIVLADRAAVFVDGRYTVQAAEQLDGSVFKVEHVVEAPPSVWLAKNLVAGDKIGFDPWLHTAESIQRLTKVCETAGAKLIAVDRNPIDAIWKDRPAAPSAPITVQPLEFTGLGALEKIAAVQDKLGLADGLLISDAHNVAWLLNIRGGDVSHTPLPLVFAYLPKAGRPTLFVDAVKLGPEASAHLEGVADVRAPASFAKFVAALGKANSRIIVDAATGPQALVAKLETAGGKALVEADPITLMKSKKTEAELNGALAAHLRDGAAMARFLAWFAQAAPKGKVTEISAAEKLEDCRRETGALKDLSFPSISAAGPHAASPHYRVSEASNVKVGKGFYLIDSGGQYQDGTTDITRTIAVGKPSALMRDRFTRVLKGHIAVARAVFPKGTTGVQIDALAREPLWRAGLDFDHGTGHGIGSYLSVHEGPQRIAKSGGVPLEPGMIISNEPGYYRPGEFGIRIENLVVVVGPETISGGEREMLGFQTISFVPIDLAAIEVELLTDEEIAWLNSYHEEVREKISPLLDRETRAWLKKATRKI